MDVGAENPFARRAHDIAVENRVRDRPDAGYQVEPRRTVLRARDVVGERAALDGHGRCHGAGNDAKCAAVFLLLVAETLLVWELRSALLRRILVAEEKAVRKADIHKIAIKDYRSISGDIPVIVHIVVAVADEPASTRLERRGIVLRSVGAVDVNRRAIGVVPRKPAFRSKRHGVRGEGAADEGDAPRTAGVDSVAAVRIVRAGRLEPQELAVLETHVAGFLCGVMNVFEATRPAV